MGGYLLARRLTVIPLIRVQEPLSPFWKGHNDGIKDCHKLTDVMSIRPGDDQRQRGATAVHKNMAFASLFFPGLSGSDQLHLERGVL